MAWERCSVRIEAPGGASSAQKVVSTVDPPSPSSWSFSHVYVHKVYPLLTAYQFHPSSQLVLYRTSFSGFAGERISHRSAWRRTTEHDVAQTRDTVGWNLRITRISPHDPRSNRLPLPPLYSTATRRHYIEQVEYSFDVMYAGIIRPEMCAALSSLG